MNWFLILILVNLKIISAIDQQTCEELKINLKEKLLGIAYTPKQKIMLITKDFLIFDDIEMVGDQDWSPGAKHSIKFGAQPKKMEQTYPDLWKDGRFMDYKDHIRQALLIQNRLELTFYFITTDYSDDCLVYYVKKPRIQLYQIDFKLGPKIALLSYPLWNYFFLLRKSSNDQLYIQINQFLIEKQWHMILGPLYMCWAADSIDKALFVSDQNCSNNRGQPIQWEIWSGMVSENKFYLFSENYVYIFNSNIVVDYDKEQPIRIVSLFKVDYHSFIPCPNDDPCTILEPTTSQFNSTITSYSNMSLCPNSTTVQIKKLVLKLVILEIFSIVLIILLAGAMFCIYRRSQSNLPSSTSPPRKASSAIIGS